MRAGRSRGTIAFPVAEAPVRATTDVAAGAKAVAPPTERAATAAEVGREGELIVASFGQFCSPNHRCCCVGFVVDGRGGSRQSRRLSWLGRPRYSRMRLWGGRGGRPLLPALRQTAVGTSGMSAVRSIWLARPRGLLCWIRSDQEMRIVTTPVFVRSLPAEIFPKTALRVGQSSRRGGAAVPGGRPRGKSLARCQNRPYRLRNDAGEAALEMGDVAAAFRRRCDLCSPRCAIWAALAQIRAHFGSVGCEGRRRRGAPPASSGRRRSSRVEEANCGGRATSGGRDMAARARRGSWRKCEAEGASFLWGSSKVSTDSYAKICQRAEDQPAGPSAR